MLEISVLPLGSYYTNCYIITDSLSGESAVIDPGIYSPALKNALLEKGIEKLSYILLTHGHFDHICGVYSLREEFGGKVVIHGEDKPCLESTEISLSETVEGYPQTVLSPDMTVSDGDKITLGETEISVMHTPGHTPGSVCYIADGNMFSGDTLFKVGIGRTDLPGGNLRTIALSLKRLGALEENYDVFPGHGESTTLDNEKAANRLLRRK